MKDDEVLIDSKEAKHPCESKQREKNNGHLDSASVKGK
jgi:hypothetical protein